MILSNKGRYSKKLTTLFGEINYMRTQLVPVQEADAQRLMEITGKKSIYPLDAFLGIDNLPFKITAKMMAAIAKEAVRAASYERAVESIRQHYGVTISNDTVRKVTDFVGGVVFDDDTLQAENAIQQHGKPIDHRKIHKRKTDILYIEMDGAMVNTRVKVDGSSWTECKIAIAFLNEDLRSWETSSGETRRQITTKQLVGYIGNYQIFKKYVLALAERYDYKYRNQIVVVSDGADWIHTLVKELFPNAVHILDLSHLKEHVGNFGKFIYKNDEEAGQKWINEIIGLIEQSNMETLKDKLLPYEDLKCPKNVLNLYTYIKNHRDCIDYKNYREHGYFVGSGASESANKYVMQDRMKLQGMRWIKDNAQKMLALKCRIEGGAWSTVEGLIRKQCNDNPYLQE